MIKAGEKEREGKWKGTEKKSKKKAGRRKYSEGKVNEENGKNRNRIRGSREGKGKRGT